MAIDFGISFKEAHDIVEKKLGRGAANAFDVLLVVAMFVALLVGIGGGIVAGFLLLRTIVQNFPEINLSPIDATFVLVFVLIFLAGLGAYFFGRTALGNAVAHISEEMEAAKTETKSLKDPVWELQKLHTSLASAMADISAKVNAPPPEELDTAVIRGYVSTTYGGRIVMLDGVNRRLIFNFSVHNRSDHPIGPTFSTRGWIKIAGKHLVGNPWGVWISPVGWISGSGGQAILHVSLPLNDNAARYLSRFVGNSGVTFDFDDMEVEFHALGDQSIGYVRLHGVHDIVFEYSEEWGKIQREQQRMEEPLSDVQ